MHITGRNQDESKIDLGQKIVINRLIPYDAMKTENLRCSLLKAESKCSLKKTEVINLKKKQQILAKTSTCRPSCSGPTIGTCKH